MNFGEILIVLFWSSGLLFLLWQTIMGIHGSRRSLSVPPAAPESDMAVVICCRNEEKVIGRLLHALQTQEYSHHRVFVVAHNCDDDTAAIAKSAGAEVIVYNAPEKRRKADALNKAMEHIRCHYGESFSCVTVFDADSVPAPDFLRKINNAMASGCDVASGSFAFLNADTNLISKLCAGLYITLMKVDSLSSSLNCLPVNVYGSGFCVRYDLIKDGWNTQTLVEDFELVVKEVLKGKKFIFAPEAVFKMEVPWTLSAALRQRLRWAVGDTQCFRLYYKDYLRSLRQPKRETLKQFFELCVTPIGLAVTLSTLLAAVKVLLSGATRLWALIAAAELTALYALALALVYDAMKYAGMKIKENLSALFLEPFWILLTLPLGALSFFIRNMDWKVTKRQGKVEE